MPEDFLKQRGYLKGTFENRLSQLGVTPDPKRTGKNINPSEFKGYVGDYQKKLSADPASVLPEYGTVSKAFGEAKKTYLDMLPSLQPRYQSLLDQISKERGVAEARDVKQSQQELLNLKSETAKRGLAVSDSSGYFAGQKSKLGEEQATRATETGLKFGREKLGVEEARTSEERAIKGAVADLTTQESGILAGILSTEKSRVAGIFDKAEQDKQFAQSLQYNRERNAIADEQWNKTFQFTQDKEAADKTLDYFRIAESNKSKPKDKNYAKDILSIVENAYNSDTKFPGMREAVADLLGSEYPEKSDQIKEDISKYFPNGWETKGQKSDPVLPVKEVGEWIYYSDGSRENRETGEIQVQA